MKIFIVDKSKKEVNNIRSILSKACDQAEVLSFDREDDLVHHLQEGSSSDRLTVKCFGYFDVFFKGRPLIFKRKQSKELLAYLIDRAGAACTSGEISMALWEDEGDEKAQQNRLRVLINDLKNTLKEIGMEDVLIRDKREIAIDKDLIDCEYYEVLDGNMQRLSDFDGEFMMQYSWAEYTNGRLLFMKEEKPKYRNTKVLHM